MYYSKQLKVRVVPDKTNHFFSLIFSVSLNIQHSQLEYTKKFSIQ